MITIANKFRASLILPLLIFSNFLAAENQPIGKQTQERVPNSWDKVGALYLPSLANKEYKQKMLTQLNAAVNKAGNQGQMTQEELRQRLQDLKAVKESEELKKALVPDAMDYTRLVLTHLASTSPDTVNLHEESKAVFDDTTYRDLKVFCGKEESPAASLFNLIDHTQTIAGRTALLDMLYNPLTSVQALRARQAAIKILVNDEELYKSVEQKLTTIKNAEHTLFIMLNEVNFKLITKITERFYLNSALQLPPQTHYLLTPLISALVAHVSFLSANMPENQMLRLMAISTASGAAIVGVNKTLKYIPFIKQLDEFLCKKINNKTTILETKNLFKHLITFVYDPYNTFNTSYSAGKNAYENYRNGSLTAGPLFNGICALALPSMTAYGFYKKDYPEIIDQTISENMLHDAIGLLAKMTVALKDLQKIVALHQELASIIPFNDFEKEANAEFKKLLTLLESENFKSPATWTTPKGKMMAILKFLCTLKYEFIPPYLAAGKLDALMSAATLYNNHVHNPSARYYFANYEEQSAPHLAINDFWNPFISPDIVVTNSLELGTKTAHRNMLITGPNAGGKSTALKAMAFAVLMAQTLTIANANTTITPFTKVFTTLNITDSTGKESLYQADKNRIQHVTSSFEGLGQNEKALLISDEIFNSTAASYGSALFYGTLKYINDSLKNTIFAVATHFETLVELEQYTHGSTANFRVEEARPGKNGKLAWTYKIKPGINKQNIAFELAQEGGFNENILNEGKKLLQRHKPPVLDEAAAAA